jgi:hypothetical protein
MLREVAVAYGKLAGQAAEGAINESSAPFSATTRSKR